MAQSSDKVWDVCVVGAGPAGAAAGAILAEKGHDVLLIDREEGSRYRVGESLIPYCWFPLNRLGLVEKLDASAFIVHKHSVQFASIEGQGSLPFYFFDHTDHPSARTWQVVRSEFDELLVENALAKGATLWRGLGARELLRDEAGAVAGVRVEGAGGAREIRARLTIDASGRDTFAQRENGWRIQDKRLRKMALWSYYKGAKRDPGRDEGATTIAYMPEKGWFWYIPLPHDTVSVGIVAEREYLFRETRDLEEIFDREVLVQRWVADHVEQGKRCEPVRATSDFSYRSLHCAEDGLLLAGDAFAFLDPVFSSGVFLALHGGVMAGDAADAALAAGDVSAERFEEYGRTFLAGMEAMRKLVYAFYDDGFSFADFLKEHPEMHHDLTDCLVGNLFRDFGAFFEAMGKFADVPEPLGHGMPLVEG